MNQKDLILDYLRLNKKRFQLEYQLSKIGLFGSMARGDNSGESDIDIIVEFQDHTADLFTKKLNLKREIQNQFNIPVDICREKYIKPIFKEQIISEALYV